MARHDLNVHGRATYGVGRHRVIRFDRRAVELFANSYRWAPVSLRWLRLCGWLLPLNPGYGWHRQARVDWTGSRREPRSTWYLRLGRCYVGGDTPRWLQRRMAERLHRQWAQDMEAMMATCPHEWIEQPGEPPVDTCYRCGAVHE